MRIRDRIAGLPASTGARAVVLALLEEAAEAAARLAADEGDERLHDFRELEPARKTRRSSPAGGRPDRAAPRGRPPGERSAAAPRRATTARSRARGIRRTLSL